MFQGSLLGIFLAQGKGEQRLSAAQVELVPGGGLTGDRFFRAGKPEQEVTLIESEALEALARECGIALEPGQARRNLLTRVVPLNHLVNRDFVVGKTLLRGIRLCEPCDHLESLTRKGVREGLLHRGGLRATVIRGGLLRVGDPIQPA
jgi:MOSC domain-containing protein YiiM